MNQNLDKKVIKDFFEKKNGNFFIKEHYDDIKFCNFCHKIAKLTCNKCKQVWYCDSVCQSYDWRLKNGSNLENNEFENNRVAHSINCKDLGAKENKKLEEKNQKKIMEYISNIKNDIFLGVKNRLFRFILEAEDLTKDERDPNKFIGKSATTQRRGKVKKHDFTPPGKENFETMKDKKSIEEELEKLRKYLEDLSKKTPEESYPSKEYYYREAFNINRESMFKRINAQLELKGDYLEKIESKLKYLFDEEISLCDENKLLIAKSYLNIAERTLICNTLFNGGQVRERSGENPLDMIRRGMDLYKASFLMGYSIRLKGEEIISQLRKVGWAYDPRNPIFKNMDNSDDIKVTPVEEYSKVKKDYDEKKVEKILKMKIRKIEKESNRFNEKINIDGKINNDDKNFHNTNKEWRYYVKMAHNELQYVRDIEKKFGMFYKDKELITLLNHDKFLKLVSSFDNYIKLVETLGYDEDITNKFINELTFVVKLYIVSFEEGKEGIADNFDELSSGRIKKEWLMESSSIREMHAKLATEPITIDECYRYIFDLYNPLMHEENNENTTFGDSIFGNTKSTLIDKANEILAGIFGSDEGPLKISNNAKGVPGISKEDKTNYDTHKAVNEYLTNLAESIKLTSVSPSVNISFPVEGEIAEYSTDMYYDPHFKVAVITQDNLIEIFNPFEHDCDLYYYYYTDGHGPILVLILVHTKPENINEKHAEFWKNSRRLCKIKFDNVRFNRNHEFFRGNYQIPQDEKDLLSGLSVGGDFKKFKRTLISGDSFYLQTADANEVNCEIRLNSPLVSKKNWPDRNMKHKKVHIGEKLGTMVGSKTVSESSVKFFKQLIDSDEEVKNISKTPVKDVLWALGILVTGAYNVNQLILNHISGSTKDDKSQFEKDNELRAKIIHGSSKKDESFEFQERSVNDMDYDYIKSISPELLNNNKKIKLMTQFSDLVATPENFSMTFLQEFTKYKQKGHDYTPSELKEVIESSKIFSTSPGVTLVSILNSYTKEPTALGLENLINKLGEGTKSKVLLNKVIDIQKSAGVNIEVYAKNTAKSIEEYLKNIKHTNHLDEKQQLEIFSILQNEESFQYLKGVYGTDKEGEDILKKMATLDGILNGDATIKNKNNLYNDVTDSIYKIINKHLPKIDPRFFSKMLGLLILGDGLVGFTSYTANVLTGVLSQRTKSADVYSDIIDKILNNNNDLTVETKNDLLYLFAERLKNETNSTYFHIKYFLMSVVNTGACLYAAYNILTWQPTGFLESFAYGRLFYTISPMIATLFSDLKNKYYGKDAISKRIEEINGFDEKAVKELNKKTCTVKELLHEEMIAHSYNTYNGGVMDIFKKKIFTVLEKPYNTVFYKNIDSIKLFDSISMTINLVSLIYNSSETLIPIIIGLSSVTVLPLMIKFISKFLKPYIGNFTSNVIKNLEYFLTNIPEGSNSFIYFPKRIIKVIIGFFKLFTGEQLSTIKNLLTTENRAISYSLKTMLFFMSAFAAYDLYTNGITSIMSSKGLGVLMLGWNSVSTINSVLGIPTMITKLTEDLFSDPENNVIKTIQVSADYTVNGKDQKVIFNIQKTQDKRIRKLASFLNHSNKFLYSFYKINVVYSLLSSHFFYEIFRFLKKNAVIAGENTLDLIQVVKKMFKSKPADLPEFPGNSTEPVQPITNSTVSIGEEIKKEYFRSFDLKFPYEHITDSAEVSVVENSLFGSQNRELTAFQVYAFADELNTKNSIEFMNKATVEIEEQFIKLVAGLSVEHLTQGINTFVNIMGKDLARELFDDKFFSISLKDEDKKGLQKIIKKAIK